MEWTTPDCLQPTPHCGPAHWARIWKACRSADLVLEYGSGGSTLWAADQQKLWKRVPRWIAVEHNYEWYREVWAALERRDSMLRRPWVLFASNPERYAYPPIEDKADVILVDGKFRDAVLEATRDYLTDDGIVFLHDAERHYVIPPHLKVIEQWADPSWEQNAKTELAVLVRA